MTGTIVRKEILANLVSYRFYVIILLATVLVATSFFVMARDYKGRLADYQLIRPEPGAPIAVLPPHALSIFAKGLEDSLTRSFEAGSTGIEVRAGQASGNVIFSFFPAPDLAYIIKVVLSLVALLFGFDAVSREKEAGTLKLTLSNAVSRSALLLGKWAGNFLCLTVPFLLVTGLGLAVMSFDPDLRLSLAAFGRLALVLAAGLVYIALFLSLGLLVSSLVRRSATSLVVLLLVWSVLVFVLPNLGTLLARQIVDVPSVKALSEKREQIWTREVLLTYTDQGSWGSRIKGMNDEFDRMEEDYRLKFDRLVRLSRAINRISPAASFMDAATEIAGTGVGEEARLKAEVTRYKNQALPSLARDRTAQEAPAFAYRPRPLTEILADSGLVDLAWLAVFNVFLFAAGYAAFIRTDPR
ncbi:MAG: ABC transporter permease [Marinilabiliales bacterium]|nr:ABC transporter permease [Marinilabiliales bacterium]